MAYVEKSYLVMLPELQFSAYPDVIPPLQLSEYQETHPETRNSYTRTVDVVGLTRHQVHQSTKQILALRTQVAELQQQLFQHEEECAYLHNQTMIDAANRTLDEQRIKDAEARIEYLMRFDCCHKCNAQCVRFRATCRACINVTVKERKAKALAKCAAVGATATESIPSPNVKQPKKAEKQKKPKAPPMPKPPRIIESEWSRDDVPMKRKSESSSNAESGRVEEMTCLVVFMEEKQNESLPVVEKSASGRRRARYTHIDL